MCEWMQANHNGSCVADSVGKENLLGLLHKNWHWLPARALYSESRRCCWEGGEEGIIRY